MMTQEQKELLLKDLCARLPYGVRVLVQSHKGDFIGTLVTVTTKLSETLGEAWIEETDEALWCDYSLFKPYLRPMSSMTEEEVEEYNGLLYGVCDFTQDSSRLTPVIKFITFLYSHHFDCCGLIEKGLALEAPENMYKLD
jgi:hypothetical protein